MPHSVFPPIFLFYVGIQDPTLHLGAVLILNDTTRERLEGYFLISAFFSVSLGITHVYQRFPSHTITDSLLLCPHYKAERTQDIIAADSFLTNTSSHES